MRSYAPRLRSASLYSLVASLLMIGCASPQTASPTGTGNSGGGNTTGSGGTTGGGNTTGSGGTGSGTACVPNPSQLVNSAAWNCDLSDPIAIQGAVYGYSDGASCPKPQPSNICSTGSCCISGTTVVDTTFAKWGCGIGMELDSSGGTAPTKSVYAGPVKCFNITLTGSSGGNVVRIGFTQSPSPPSGAVAPYTELPAFTNGWTGQVCFADVSCPSWAVTAGTCTKTGTDGTPVDLQIQVSAGSTTATVGAYNVCVSSIVPVSSSGTGGSGGGATNSCPTPSSSGTITTQFGDAHVGCPKDYIVQNNAWGSTAGQTITYGPGTKLKVTDQKGTGSGGAPASYPSIFTGGYNGRSTAQSGLPLAVSSISATGVSTSWTWADTSVTGSYNAAYDVWFSTGAGGDPSSAIPSGGYLMVWYYKPSDNQPVGATIPNGTATINGKQFNIWYGTNNGRPVVSYVAAQKMNSWTFPLGAFIQDAVGRTCSGSTKCLQSSWYLTTVFSGFEIWSGGVGLATTDFGVTVP
jgi:Glycosyl hydrolase family 12